MKLPHRFVQLAGELGNRLCADWLACESGHHSSHLARRDPAQESLPNQNGHIFGSPLELLQSWRQEVLPARPRDPQPNRAQPRHVISFVKAVPVIVALARVHLLIPTSPHVAVALAQ